MNLYSQLTSSQALCVGELPGSEITGSCDGSIFGLENEKLQQWLCLLLLPQTVYEWPSPDGWVGGWTGESG